MSGTNQASNLSGLFAGFETELQDPKMFNRGIENMFRPDFDTSEQGLLEAAAWEAKMGRAPEANALTAAAQQKQLARVADAEAAQAPADVAYGNGIQQVQGLLYKGEQLMDPRYVDMAEQRMIQMGPAMNPDQGRMRDGIDFDKARGNIKTAQAENGLRGIVAASAALDAELAKPADQQNPAAIEGLTRSVDQWRQAHPEQGKKLDEARLKEIDLEEKETARQKAADLDLVGKEVAARYARGETIDDIKDYVSAQPNVGLEEMQKTFEMLGSMDENIAKMKERGATAEAVAMAEDDLMSMVDNMADLPEAQKEQFKKNISTSLKVADLLPQEALKRAEYFTRQITQFNLGVEQGRLREWAAAEGNFRSLVNQIKVRSMNNTERGAVLMLLEQHGDPDDVPRSQWPQIASSMRLAAMNLEEYANHEFDENGNILFKDGQPVLKPESMRKDVNQKPRAIFDASNGLNLPTLDEVLPPVGTADGRTPKNRVKIQ